VLVVVVVGARVVVVRPGAAVVVVVGADVVVVVIVTGVPVDKVIPTINLPVTPPSIKRLVPAMYPINVAGFKSLRGVPPKMSPMPVILK
jgi:hypothetical protein